MFEEGVGSVPTAAQKGMSVLDVAEMLERSVVRPEARRRV
jgi:hypothetical protein